MYFKIILKSVDLDQKDKSFFSLSILILYNQIKINKALNISITKQMPVHINVPFSELSILMSS